MGLGRAADRAAGRGIAAGMFGYLTSFVVARFRHLALIMITLGFGLVLQEAANSASWLTGGFDGLQGIHTWPLLGTFRFDLYGYTAYGYALAGLFVIFLVARRHHSFAVRAGAARHPRERRCACRRSARQSTPISARSTRSPPSSPASPARMLTQTTETVSLEALGFQRSADVLVMLILGGTGRLYGGLIGAAVYMVARDQFSGTQSAILVFLDRPAADRGRHVPAERHSRRAAHFWRGA